MTTLNIPDEWEAEELGFADLNTYLRDNIITIDSAISLTNTGYGCGLSTAGSLNVATSTWTALSFGAGSEEWDDDTMHDVTTNNSRITIKEAGRYQVNGSAFFNATNSIGSRMCAVYKNGAFADYGSSRQNGGGELVEVVNLSSVLALDVDDYIEFYVQQTSGGVRALTTRRFTCHRLKYDGT